jgi:hypothetical protein
MAAEQRCEFPSAYSCGADSTNLAPPSAVKGDTVNLVEASLSGGIA